MHGKLKKYISCAFFLLLFGISPHVIAQSKGGDTLTANVLYDWCKERNTFCDGYIVGFLDGVTRAVHFHVTLDENYHLSGQTLQRTFIKFLDDHPEFGDVDASIILITVMSKLGVRTNTDTLKR